MKIKNTHCDNCHADEPLLALSEVSDSTERLENSWEDELDEGHMPAGLCSKCSAFLWRFKDGSLGSTSPLTDIRGGCRIRCGVRNT